MTTSTLTAVVCSTEQLTPSIDAAGYDSLSWYPCIQALQRIPNQIQVIISSMTHISMLLYLSGIVFWIITLASQWAYTGVVRPKLLDGCMIWGKSINTNCLKKALKTLDRLATRSLTTFQRNTRQASIEIMIDLIPVDIMIKKTGITSYIRLKNQLAPPATSNSTRKIPHLQYWEDAAMKYDLKNICLLYTSPSPRDRQKSRMPSSA